MASTSRDPTPPYPSAARISDSPCYPQYSASLKCTFTLVLKYIAQRRANVKNILMFTRNARRKSGKLDWNATRHGLSSHEIIFRHVS